MLIGRKKEISNLNKMLSSNSSELIAVYGRRRVGKTYLIREVYRKNMVFEFTGYYKGSMHDQLRNFHKQLQSSSGRFNKVKTPGDWITAFQMLEKFLNNLKSTKKKIVFIDEFPWIATSRSKFLMAFEHFWNTYCTKRNDLVVVICGSAASFMINKIIRNRGGLHNRLSYKLQLLPFNLNETEQFLKSKGIHLNQYDILQLYMVVGGVPHYLDKINRGESVIQNIDRLCFESNGDLVNEFNEIFTSLFSNSKTHEKIIRVLSKTKRGIARNELLKLCKFGSGGVLSRTLEELIESGFVSQYTPFGKKIRNSLFRLSDEYSMFYLKFIEPNTGQGSGTWANFFPKQTYRSWTGFVFETICLKHVQQIKKELGVAKIYSVHSSWFNSKAQVDLVIDRDDRIINLCEIKFYNCPYIINKPAYDNLKNKLVQFKESTKSRKNVFVTMITTFGVSENANSLELVTNNITIGSLFE
jgi:hypothetical protein